MANPFIVRWLSQIFGKQGVAKKKRLIVGLGNPGPEYAATRHNIGFMVADNIAEKAKIEIDVHKWNAMSGWGSWRNHAFGIAKPMTYMNLSGDSLGLLLRKNKIDVQDLMVVVDDVHLPFGTIRIRAKGGSGGHNGIESIINEVGSSSFVRMRCGVGNDFHVGGQSDYVLSEFAESEQEQLAEFIDRASKAALTFIASGVNVAMNRFNKKEEKPN